MGASFRARGAEKGFRGLSTQTHPEDGPLKLGHFPLELFLSFEL